MVAKNEIKKIREEQRTEVVKMYEAGHTWRDISNKVGVSSPWITTILREAGHKVHRHKDTINEVKKRREYLRKWLSGMTHKYDVSPMTIRNDLTKIIEEERAGR